MDLELVYPAENRCESSGIPAGAFPNPPRGQVGPGSGPKFDDFRSLPTPKKPKTLLIALEFDFLLSHALCGNVRHNK